MNLFRALGLVLALSLIGHAASAEWEADSTDKNQTRAADAIANFHENVPRTEQYFEQAFGYAVLPFVISAFQASKLCGMRMASAPGIFISRLISFVL